MTDTITPEERARIRAIASNIRMLSHRDDIHGALNSLLDALEQTEDSVARLTKELDWMSEKCAMHCHDKDGDEMCSYDTCGMFNCWHVSECEWKEAASRAVAAVEGE